MCLDDNVRCAEAYMRKGLHLTAQEYIDRVRNALPYLTADERKIFEERHAHFIQLYIKPDGSDICYDGLWREE